MLPLPVLGGGGWFAPGLPKYAFCTLGRVGADDPGALGGFPYNELFVRLGDEPAALPVLPPNRLKVECRA